MYTVILCVWGACVLSLFIACAWISHGVTQVYGVNAKVVFAVFLLFINAAMLGYMWLGSVKDFLFSFTFLCFKKRIVKPYEKIIYSTIII